MHKNYTEFFMWCFPSDNLYGSSFAAVILSETFPNDT